MIALASLTSWGLQGHFNFTASYFHVWDPHMIFWNPLKVLGHLPSSALSSILGSTWFHSTDASVLGGHPMVLASPIHNISSSALCSNIGSGWSTLLMLLFLVIIPWSWHFQYTGVFHCNCASWSWHFQYTGVFHCNCASSIASHRFPSWQQASTPLPDLFFQAINCNWSCILANGLSQCQASAAFHDPFMLSKPVPPGRFSHITKSCFSTTYSLGFLWNIASACSQKTLHRRFHLSDIGIFLTTANFLASANHHQLGQKFLLSLTLKPEAHGWSFQVLLLAELEYVPRPIPCFITLSQAFCFLTPSQTKLACPGTCSVDWPWTQRSTWFCVLKARTEGMYHHAWA